MVSVKEQYEVYPYPERNPEDEARRLISGSPSLPWEIDHYLYEGTRNWSDPFRVLVAGGGTGDALVQLAFFLTKARVPYDITYIDLSTASREIAEARIKARGLEGVTFVTGSLLDAPQYGPFDYIDCCGVLHHLPDPEAGFAALRAALAPGGGLGFMVYATYGRSGIYPLQEAFGTLLEGLDPEEKLKRAKAIVASLPKGHPFMSNPGLTDHKQNDAGFYDLLLHSQDRPYTVPQLAETLSNTGWRLQGFCLPGLYDLSRVTQMPREFDPVTAMGIAEKLRGTIKKHSGYAVPADEERPLPRPGRATLVPRFTIPNMGAVAQALARGQALPINLNSLRTQIRLPRETAPIVAAVDGKRPLSEVARTAGVDPLRFNTLWTKIDREFSAWGLMHYTRFGVR
jgi:SAM-dependent methyltransferase